MSARGGLRQMLAARRQLACQLLAFALALDVLMIESLPLELEAADALRQLAENTGHLRLALVIGVLLGAAERARFTVAQDVAMLLETGDGAGLLQRVARPLQAVLAHKVEHGGAIHRTKVPLQGGGVGARCGPGPAGRRPPPRSVGASTSRRRRFCATWTGS